ncbi:MAG: peptidylprolyl isomerase [Thiotrichaceae bacterium]|nr:peptidylprolyl isomerase [Thiotrichaceae bacterium]
MNDKKDDLKISDKEIKTAYEEAMKGQETQEFKARHILVKKEKEAKKIIESLTAGGDFEKLAKEKSTGPSGPKGGDLGWFTARTMVPAFAKAITEMKKGAISTAPVKTTFGWHVIKLEDTRKAKLPSMKSLEAQLKRGIEQDKLLEFIDSLKESADIKITLPEEVKTEEKKEKSDTERLELKSSKP